MNALANYICIFSVLPLVGRVGFSPPGIWEFSYPYYNQGGGADYAHHVTASPPGFENPAAALTVHA